MKSIKLLAIIMLLALAVPLVSAAEKYYFDDFSETPNQGIILEEGDIVQFSLLGADHFIRIKEISRDKSQIKFNIYPYKGSAQQVPFFGLDNVIHVDLNKDGINDIAFDITDISEDRRVTLIASAEQPSEEVPKGQGMVVKETGNKFKRTYLFIGLIIVGLIGILALRNSKDNNSNNDENSDNEESKPSKEELKKAEE